MLLLTETVGKAEMLPIADAGIYALLGYCVVFLGLILLMIVVLCVGKIFSAKADKKAEMPAAAEEVKEQAKQPAAPGTAGELKLHNVELKTAAMLMAIVADKMGKPLNELRFISIKEVE